MHAEGAESAPSDALLIGRALGFIDDGDIPALLAMLHPDIEWRPPRQGTLDEVYIGHDGVRTLFGALTEAWDSFEHHPLKLVKGRDLSIVITKLKLHAQASDVVVDELWAYAMRIEDGAFTFVEMYTDPEEALREHMASTIEGAPDWPAQKPGPT
jgi:ketosteroid isomerase-like protein